MYMFLVNLIYNSTFPVIKMMNWKHPALKILSSIKKFRLKSLYIIDSLAKGGFKTDSFSIMRAWWKLHPMLYKRSSISRKPSLPFESYPRVEQVLLLIPKTVILNKWSSETNHCRVSKRIKLPCFDNTQNHSYIYISSCPKSGILKLNTKTASVLCII